MVLGQAQHLADRGGEQRRGQGEGGGGACQQGEDSHQVYELPPEPVYPAAQKGAAGFRVFLLVSSPHMEHKAKGDCQNQIKAPGDRSPVEKRVGGGPVLHIPHLGDPGFSRVQDPFT